MKCHEQPLRLLATQTLGDSIGEKHITESTATASYLGTTTETKTLAGMHHDQNERDEAIASAGENDLQDHRAGPQQPLYRRNS
jgi:hypothetical protein